jgi:hypothetical protein
MAEINEETGMWEPALEGSREATIEQLAQCAACPHLVEGEGCPLLSIAQKPSTDPEVGALCGKIVARLRRLN